MAERNVEEVLEAIAGTGLKAAGLMGATAELIKSLKGYSGSRPIESLLTGDLVADKAIIRAAGVEDVIKNRFSFDLDQVLDFLYFLLQAGPAVKVLFQ